MTTPRYLSAKATLVVALFAIAITFFLSSYYTYAKLDYELMDQELVSQKKLSNVFRHSLAEYFTKMQLVAEYASTSAAFAPEKTQKVDRLRYLQFYGDTTQVRAEFGLDSILRYISPYTPTRPTPPIRPYVWQVFKGLPEKNANGEIFAGDRRAVARTTMQAFRGLHYVFELDANGDMIFLEPFRSQKNISALNYAFRDYFQEVKLRKRTVLSEGYFSRDKERTRIITVAAPIRDSLKTIRRIIAVSVSADTLREQVFGPLSRGMDLGSTVIYLLDRHGHVVTSSNGRGVYSPRAGALNDQGDPGNLRNSGILRDLPWRDEVLEPQHHSGRQTRSWHDQLPQRPRSAEYRNHEKIQVIGTFLPISLIDSTLTRWALLIETPTANIRARSNELLVFYVGAGLFLALILTILGFVLFTGFAKVEADLQEVAEQVSHDIRSPLAALDLLTQSFGHLPEERRILIRSSVNRIQDIANDLARSRHRDTSSRTVLMSSVLSEIVSEKRIQYRPRLDMTIETDIGPESYGLFAEIPPAQLSRVLSNVVDNAADAVGDKGVIRVSLRAEGQVVSVSVTDDGPGIPQTVLARLGKERFKSQKLGGKGLGLFDAKRVLDGLGGQIDFHSTVGVGTTITVTVPRSAPPKWFVPELRIVPAMLFAVVDDDQSIHQIWSDRLARAEFAGQGIDLRHFSSPGEFIEFMRQNPTHKHRLFLLDYEYLGEPRDGLSVVEELGIARESVLVTSHFEAREVLRRAGRLGVGVLPKSMAPYVPLTTDLAQRIPVFSPG